MEADNNIEGNVKVSSNNNHSNDIDDDNTQESTTNSSTSSSTSNSTSPMQQSACQHNQEEAQSSEWTGSLVEYYGPSSSHCGYCKHFDPLSEGGRRSYDMQAYQLTAHDYQAFLDRGWRRSGKFCYCPINQTTCCPNFSITCQAIKFKLSRSQRKCIERLNNYLYTGSVKLKAPINYSRNGQNNDLFSKQYGEQVVNDSGGKTYEQLKISTKARDRRFVRACERKSRLMHISLEEASKIIKSKWQQQKPQLLTLEDYLYPRQASEKMAVNNSKHKLQINMYYVNSRQSKELRNDEHEIMVKYQKSVHKETRREWTMHRYNDFLVNTPILNEKLKNYDYVQDNGEENENVVAKETLSRNVNLKTIDTFILHCPPQLPTAYGTYHCSYHLDGKLLAVGVLDVLPKCITTVYFFYNPEYSFLNLGVYSALVEISMLRQIWSRYKVQQTTTTTTTTLSNTHVSENILKHYYLGYYVHECKKMHYKTKFKPSYLLCCKSYEYIETEKCLELLKHTKYADFSQTSSSLSASLNNSTRDNTIEFKSLLDVTIKHPLDIEQFSIGTTKLLNYLLWLETNLSTEYVELFVNGYLATFAHLIGSDLLEKLCLKLNVVHRTLMKRCEGGSSSSSLAQRKQEQKSSTKKSSSPSEGHSSNQKGQAL